MATSPGYTDRSQTLPFSGASDLQFRMARCFAMLTDFAAALHGRAALGDVTQGLIRQVEGANLVFYRIRASGEPPQVITAAVRRADAVRPERPTGTLARHLLERHADDMEPGSIWRLSEFAEDPDFAVSPAGREWSERTDLIEVSLIVLEHRRGHLDVIEIQFDRPPNRHKDIPTTMITASMAEAWAARESGLIARLIAANGRTRAPANHAAGHILGSGNPCGLSRAELRVCHLLAVGLKAADIARNLGVSIATTRTHLRNIYAKTGTSGQIEVMAMLRADRRGDPEDSHRTAGPVTA